MDENLTIWVERIFNIAFLEVIWTWVITMIWCGGDVAPKACKAAALVTWAFTQ
ncbi:hypothetical protein KA005_02965 [bacterium]|nr:hypothetical protein [bacterium]